MAPSGPLILGAGGRVGTMFRRLAAQGMWPGPEPLWHTRDGRDGTLGWDLDVGPPSGVDLSGAWGVVVLAGATGGDDEALLANTHAAFTGIDLARDLGLGPVLLCSSASVYGRAPGPRGEDDAPDPASSYGMAKLEMERAVTGEHLWTVPAPAPPTCCLRIGNVAGGDMVFGNAARGPMNLDLWPDGTTPRRAYVGPLTLARALVALLARDDLPPVLNLAQPGLVAMGDVLDAAGVPWTGVPPPPTALTALEMDLTRLAALAPLPPATPEGLVTEARLAGWRPFAGAA